MISFIYGLIDPRNNEVRYVGKADDPDKRLRCHISSSQLKSNDHRSKWIKKILSLGLKLRIIILDSCAGEEWKEKERYWIDFFRSKKCSLVNHLDGGEGGSEKGRIVSKEARLKSSISHMGMSPSNKGIPCSEETKRKVSESLKKYYQKNKTYNFGKKAPKELKEKLSKVHLGIKASEETKIKMSKAHKGKKFSKEHCEKISKAKKGKLSRGKDWKHSEETKAKIKAALKGRRLSLGMTGKKHSEETKRKIREAKCKASKNNLGTKHLIKKLKCV